MVLHTFLRLLVVRLLLCDALECRHLGFIQNGRHRRSPAWLPREIGSRWSYLTLVQKWCLWNNLNNHMTKPPISPSCTFCTRKVPTQCSAMSNVRYCILKTNSMPVLVRPSERYIEEKQNELETENK